MTRAQRGTRTCHVTQEIFTLGRMALDSSGKETAVRRSTSAK